MHHGHHNQVLLIIRVDLQILKKCYKTKSQKATKTLSYFSDMVKTEISIKRII